VPGEHAIRPATPADLDPVRALAAAYGNLRHWPDRPDYLDHELATGRMLLAEDEAGLAGFAAVLERDGVTHLADLVVRSDRLGQGVGRALLAAILPARGERTTFASADPRALPLYARAGMRPVTPLLYLRGDRASAARLPDPGTAAGSAGPGAVADLDRVAAGRRRGADHAFLATAGASALLVGDGDRTLGYGWVRVPAGAGPGLEAFLGPLGAGTEDDARRVVIAAVRYAAARAQTVHVPLLGPHPALAPLLAAGFRIEDTDTFMTSRVNLLDPRRYTPSPDLG